MKKKNWIIWTVVAVVIIVIGWFSFGHSSQTSSKTVTVGVVGINWEDLHHPNSPLLQEGD